MDPKLPTEGLQQQSVLHRLHSQFATEILWRPLPSIEGTGASEPADSTVALTSSMQQHFTYSSLAAGNTTVRTAVLTAQAAILGGGHATSKK